MDLRASAAEVVLKLSVLSAVLLLSVTSDNAQAVIPIADSASKPQKGFAYCTVFQPKEASARRYSKGS